MSYHGVGADAVEFVICHAEVPIVFAEEKKIPEVNTSLKVFVNFFFKTLW